MMNHEIRLTLELLENAEWGFVFKLTAKNDSNVPLLLPAPRIYGIRFQNTTTVKESEWYTRLLVSGDCGEFVLRPAESKDFLWRVRPCDVEGPADWSEDPDRFRWCVEAPGGEYAVWYRWRVDDEFFDPVSHFTLSDLQHVAGQKNATAWQGEVVSNRIELVRA